MLNIAIGKLIVLAPLVGQIAAMEILDGVRVDLLVGFRYERLLRRR